MPSTTGSSPPALERATAAAGPVAPLQPLFHLDALWIQVAGTLCNLACTHCFVTSGPGDDHHALMPRDEVRNHVAQALALGAKEFYFTGGEPFVHPALLEIIDETLAHGPVTVLTNGTLFTRARVAALTRLSATSRYALELRVSLDGPSAAEHDSFRGPGSFERVLAGLRALVAAGLLPIVTATQGPGDEAMPLIERYLAMLRGAGITRPRLKLLPMFQLGREVTRSRDYEPTETLIGLPPAAFDPHRLQCSGCRAVTSRGVFVCPLLVDEPRAHMADSLERALGPFSLRFGACYTCHVTGMTCGNG